MKVKLIRYTPEGEKLIASAGRLCYSKSGVEDIEENITEDTIERMVKFFNESGHHSPLEHVSFTFGVEGVSRSLTHQLVRHRIASYSQQSQRYVTEDKIECIIPPSIRADNSKFIRYNKAVEDIHQLYSDLIKSGIPKEDARYLLPNATETKIVFTMNARTLIHFFKLRCCNRAQWEIRELADNMLKEVKAVYPILFKNVGPSCVSGPCPEGKMTCGMIKEIRKKYK